MDLIEIHFDRRAYHLINEMMNWCYNNIGKGGYGMPLDSHNDSNRAWGIDVAFGNSTFYFCKETDAMMFGLRWIS